MNRNSTFGLRSVTRSLFEGERLPVRFFDDSVKRVWLCEPPGPVDGNQFGGTDERP